MKKISTLILAGMFLSANALAAKPIVKKAVHKPNKAKTELAIIHTTVGNITVKLLPKKSPHTVANFVGLSTGAKEWTNPKTGKKMIHKPLYNGTIFHRVIPGFMIQGGDPLGTGMGGPGYKFNDEVSPSDSFDHPGIVAMANSGPNTNGSQFFITVKAAPWLNGHYSIFGQVTHGMKVVNKIVNAPRGKSDRPLHPVKITHIAIIKR